MCVFYKYRPDLTSSISNQGVTSVYEQKSDFALCVLFAAYFVPLLPAQTGQARLAGTVKGAGEKLTAPPP